MRAAVLVLFLTLPPVARAGDVHAVNFDSRSMGTVINLVIWTGDDGSAAEAANAVFAEFRRIDRLMSSWLPASDVSMINAGAGKPVKISGETIMVISRAQDAAEKSGGAFDITVGAFRGLWKFDQDLDGSIPGKSAIAGRVRLVDYHDVAVDKVKRTVMLRRKGMRITLGGVAKGYAVDRTVEILRGRGFKDFLIHAGGDLYVAGRRGNRPWRAGIQDPRGAPGSIFATAEIKDAAFSTSGDYERGFVRNGVRYHHILDPGTGYPARRSRSVTVLARSAMAADMWSTALFVLGAGRGLALVEKTPGLDAVFITADNRVRFSSGFKGVLKIIKPPTPGP